MSKRILILIFLLLPLLLQAQQYPKPDYPKGYFENPLHIPIVLAGNYGELRPGHFHEGLDIKTKGAIGYRVYAAAAGYISRVSVSNTGFGHAIYITHPNGYTTVYGHLHQYNDKLAGYVKKQQYKQQQWKIDLSLAPQLFPVKKGQFIALSGMTGSAAGPHVHFEIRNTKSEHPLNGQLWGFKIIDNIPPRVYRIALYDRNKSIYEQTPKILLLHANKGHYSPSPAKVVVNTDKVGFGVQSIDHQNNTGNTYGIYRETLYADHQPQCGFQLDDIGYDETRYVDAHYDYKTYKETRRHFELLFSLPGNKLPIYHNFDGNGTVNIGDGKVHPIKILVRDAAGNTSTITLEVQEVKKIAAAKSIVCNNSMYPNSRDIFENKHVQFNLPPGSIYDSICFDYKRIPTSASGYYSDIYRLHHSYVPLYNSFTLRIKPDKPIPENLKNKTVFVCKDPNGRVEGITPAVWNGAWLKSSVRSFGDYSVQVDDVPPVLKALNIHNGANLSKAHTIKFRIGDRKSGLHSYRAELDGQWLMFARKGSTIFYTFDAHCPPGNHTLKVTVTDRVGNKTIKIYHFKR